MTNLVSLDVRPILESGIDPFKVIMEAIQELKKEETLKIINTFEPIPLINKLEKKGYKSWTERPEEGVVHTFFKLGNGSKKSGSIDSVAETSEPTFDDKLKYFEGKLKIIDVRYLEMPEPMTTILQEIELIPKGNALFVEHKKVPQFLLPELKARNFEILYKKQSEEHLQLLIFKQ